MLRNLEARLYPGDWGPCGQCQPAGDSWAAQGEGQGQSLI